MSDEFSLRLKASEQRRNKDLNYTTLENENEHLVRL